MQSQKTGQRTHSSIDNFGNSGNLFAFPVFLPSCSQALLGDSVELVLPFGPVNFSERSTPMFVRIVELNAKTGKGKELARTINDQVLTILKNQPGFVDEVALVSPDNPDRGVAVSFWQSREDAEKYHKEAFPKISEILRPVLEGAPLVRVFDVVTSTAHNIVGAKAA
jgi:heme-degrading monooxygenase HmoA